MNKQQFQRELDYGATISIATSLFRRHLITPTEFNKLKAALIKKYRPVIWSLQETASAVSSPKQVDDFQQAAVKRLPQESNIVKNERSIPVTNKIWSLQKKRKLPTIKVHKQGHSPKYVEMEGSIRE